jgi:hypothetical protein
MIKKIKLLISCTFAPLIFLQILLVATNPPHSFHPSHGNKIVLWVLITLFVVSLIIPSKEKLRNWKIKREGRENERKQKIKDWEDSKIEREKIRILT